MNIKQAVEEAINLALVASPGPVSHHVSGVPFDTGALLDSITYHINEDGSGYIEIGAGIEYNEWLNESSKTRQGWVDILTQQIADAIAIKLNGALVAESDDGTIKKLK